MTTPDDTAAYKQVRHPWLVQLSVGVGTIVTTIDSSAVNVAINSVAEFFGVDVSSTSWLALIAFLIVTSTLLLFGRLSDLLGAKRVYIAGFVVYGAGSLLAGMAPSFPLLLLFRGIQALGVSMLSANSLAILTECYPPHQRGMAVGLSSTVVGLGYFVGPVMAGELIVALGWRFVFLGMVPVAFVGLVLNWIVLPRSTPRRGRGFDFPGAAIFAFAATSLLLGINVARGSSFLDPVVLGLVGLAVVAVYAFLRVERRAPAPMLQLSLFRNRLFSISLFSAFLLFFGITGQELLVPIFIQRILGEEASVAGRVIAIVPFLRMVLASPSGLLSDRIGSRWLTALGATLTAGGLFGLAIMNASTPLVWIIVCMVVIGLGQGIFFSPNMHAIMTSVPPEMLGVASGALGLRRNLGQSMGVAVAAYLLQTGSGGAQAAVPGFQVAFVVAAAAVAVSAVLTMVGGSTPRHGRR